MMNKFVNYFLAVFAVTTLVFLASCSEDEVPPITDEATLSFEVDGTETDTITAFPGEDVAIDVVFDRGDENPTTLVVLSGTGDELNTYPLDNATSPIQYVHTVPDDVSADIDLTFELRDGTTTLAEEVFTIDVQSATVADAVIENDDLSELEDILTSAGLVDDLQGDGPYTIFAPTNAAFASLDLTGLTDDEISEILLSHVIADSLTTGELTSGYLTTLSGDSVYVDVTAGAVTVNGVAVSTADVVAGNGVVHIIDEALVPDVTTYSAFLLVSPSGDGTTETFYSTSTGTRYSYNDVLGTTEPVSATIDFGYYYGAQDNATIASPDSYPTEIYAGLAAWNTRNNTDFRATTMAPEDFDVITFSQGDDVEAEFEAGTELENAGRAKGLQAEDVIAFTTQDGRFGLIKVVEIVDGNGDGEFDGIQDGIEIQVKVTR